MIKLNRFIIDDYNLLVEASNSVSPSRSISPQDGKATFNVALTSNCKSNTGATYF